MISTRILELRADSRRLSYAPSEEVRTSRRQMLSIGAAAFGSGCVTPLRYVFPETAEGAAFELAEAEPCAPGARTPEIAEGPFYRPATPRRRWIAARDSEGERLVIEGRVLGIRCAPIERAVLDFWQADERGDYDNGGQRFRGHQFTMRGGLYRLVTVIPGPETVIGIERTPHIHVKVQAPGAELLTTQIYFAEEEERNRRDGLFDERMTLEVDRSGRVARARFDFILPSG